MSLTGEAKQEAERLLRLGARQDAVQYLNSTFDIPLQDAAALVEALEQEVTGDVAPESSPAVAAPSETKLKMVIAQLLAQDQKVEAVNYVRHTMDIGLREALALVESVAKETDPQYKSVALPGVRGCLQVLAKGLGVLLLIVSLFFLAVAGVIFYLQSDSIRDSDAIAGKVTKMNYMSTGESAPVVEYEWNGKVHSYAATTYSSPPDYEVGQTIPLFVNRSNPEDVLLDTFMARYAIIVGLGVIGGFLGLVSAVFLYFGRRKF